MHFCVFGRIKKLQILFLGCLKTHNFLGQRSLNSINKLLFYKSRVSNLYPTLLIVLLNFSIQSDRTDTFSMCHISFDFSDGAPLIFMNHSLSDEFQGITL